MIKKLTIINDDKLMIYKFSIIKNNDNIIIKPINNDNKIIKVPILNKYNCLDYYPVTFPLECSIINNKIFTEYLILYSFNMKIDNNIDFFYNLFKYIKDTFDIDVIYYNEIISIKDDIINTNKDIYKEYHDINKYINQLKLNEILNPINEYKYNLYPTLNHCNKTINEYLILNPPLSINELVINNDYYIKMNNNIIRIRIVDINYENNIIKIDDNYNNIITFNENIQFYTLYPNLDISKESILYNTFINTDFTINIMMNNLNIIKSEAINLLYLIETNKYNNILDSNENTFENNLNILKNMNITNDYFENMVDKYPDKFNEILIVLCNNYNYPLKYNNRNKLDNVFDYIMYISLVNYNKQNINIDTFILNVNTIIPTKIRNLYITLLKCISQIVNNNYDILYYNQKLYTDYLYKTIIKLLFSNDTDSLFVKYLIKIISIEKYNTIKDIIIVINQCIDINKIINWSNLSKRLSYLTIFYNTDYFNKYNILYYNEKINKTVLSDMMDIKIKKIILNPFEMYNFLKKERDFIKWTKFISNKINNLYSIQISLILKDIINIGRLIYLLYNINEQNINDPTYIQFINFCNKNNNIIIQSSRIILKIKEYFPNIKCMINLGILAKHLTWDRNNISFDTTLSDKTEEELSLEIKLYYTMKKYKKYKHKYIKIKTETEKI